MVQVATGTWLQWKTNGKSYMACLILLLQMTLSEFEVHFCCLKPL